MESLDHRVNERYSLLTGTLRSGVKGFAKLLTVDLDRFALGPSLSLPCARRKRLGNDGIAPPNLQLDLTFMKTKSRDSAESPTCALLDSENSLLL